MPRKAEYSSPIFICCFRYRTVAPNGIRASFASLKHCLPKGIPMIVTHSTAPSTAASTAMGIPLKINQKILQTTETALPPYSTSLPNGKKCKLRKLEALLPNGDTNDRDAPEHTSSHPAETGPQPAEQKPKNISQTAHSSRLPFLNMPTPKCDRLWFHSMEKAATRQW